jgi:hypothetical protein
VTATDVNTRIVTFLVARIEEIEDVDPDRAAKCDEILDAACEMVDISPWPEFESHYVHGAVKNKRALLELARQWSDHPDFQEDWR